MAPQQSGGQDQGSSDLIWISCIVVVLLVATWYFGGKYITAFIYQVKGYEIIAIQFVLYYWNMAASAVHLPMLQVSDHDLQMLLTRIQHRQMGVSMEGLIITATAVGDYLRFVIVPILVIFSILVYKKSIGMRFKTVFDMNKMRAAEKMDRPQITPILKLNLVKEDIDQGLGRWR